MAGVTEYLKRYSVLGWLVGANVAVFVVVGLSLVMARAGLGIELDSFVTLPSVWEVFLREPWTLLTYMFVHTHPIHLIFNLLWLGWFGSMLLQSISQRSLLWLYLGGGVAGGLVYLIFAPHIQLFNGRLLGASASVLALMAYAAVKMPNYRLHLFS